MRGLAAAALAAPAALALLVVAVLGGGGDGAAPPAGWCRAGGPDTALPAGATAKPVRTGTAVLTSGFGMRWGRMHQGLDLAGPTGTPVYAFADGVVARSGPAGPGWEAYGHWVVIDHNVGGRAMATLYGHLDRALAPPGPVRAGQLVGLMGSRGDSTGPHLHFELWQGSRWAGTALDPAPHVVAAAEPGPASPAGAADPAAAPAAPAAPAGGACAGLGGALDAASVPGGYAPWLARAGALCPQVTPSLLAAQLHAESGFDAAAVSYAGAQGPAQFMPGTWPAYGRDDDGNGRASPFDVGDAVMAQGRFMCEIAATVDAAVADGRVAATNGPTELYLAAYNAGPGAVLRSGGFPAGHPDYTTQTRPYADKIIAAEARYRAGAGQ